jgi:hypothetical protein
MTYVKDIYDVSIRVLAWISLMTYVKDTYGGLNLGLKLRHPIKKKAMIMQKKEKFFS